MNTSLELPLPDHFDPSIVNDVWRVDYETLAVDARRWAQHHTIPPASEDRTRVGLVLIDCQNTFCTPGHELYVQGRSGDAAVQDSLRICRFIYRNLARLTEIRATMDTHEAFQIFHGPFWLNDEGRHPEPLTVITQEDVESGRWKPNPAVVAQGGWPDYETLADYALHYVKQLSDADKYDLTIWPFHAMLGGIGHALVPAIEEAVFFHSIARQQNNRFEIKGGNPWTEHYSVIRPEVTTDQEGRRIEEEDPWFFEMLRTLDAVFVAGQAKSHCLFWTVDNLLEDVRNRGMEHTLDRVFLLEDCTSPVVVPGIVDFTEQADAAFQRFAQAGMRLVQSTDSLDSLLGGA